MSTQTGQGQILPLAFQKMLLRFIPKCITHHILRHCNSTHNRQLGAKDYGVMELLGQQSTKIHAIYTHAEWQNIVCATARLGAAIGQDGLSAQAHEAEE